MAEGDPGPASGQPAGGGGMLGGEGGTAAPEWVNALPDDIRTPEAIPTFSKYKADTDADFARVPKSLLKSHIEVQKMVGKKGVIIPDEKATTQEREAFYTALGRPKSAEDYGLKKPDGLPDALGVTEDRIKEYAKTLHGLGLTKDQATKLFEAEVGRAKSTHESQIAKAKETHERALADYKKQYGDDFQKVDAAITQAVKTVGGDELVSFLMSTGLRDAPILMNAFKKVADMMGEHQFKGGGGGGGGDELTESKIMEMMRDPRYNGGHKDGQYIPPDAAYQKQIQEAWKKLYPDKTA